MKIYDCFPFYNENQILMIRMNELDPIVDFFVISEADRTHSGHPKPLYLENSLAVGFYDKFRSKIIRLEADLNNVAGFDMKGAWARENKQRNKLMDVLAMANDDDIILLSDIDEIPSKEFIEMRKKISFEMHPLLLSKQFFYYYNFKQRKRNQCHGTIAFTKKSLGNRTFQELRDQRFYIPYVESSGWHLSFFGTPEHIQNKINTYAHTEFKDSCSLKQITDRIVEGKDLFGRDGIDEELIYIKNNKDIPSCILANKEKYKDLL